MNEVSLNKSYQTANEFYRGDDFWRVINSKSDFEFQNDFNIGCKVHFLIQFNGLNDLIKSEEFRKYIDQFGVNHVFTHYRFTESRCKTLLDIAKELKKTEIADYLTSIGGIEKFHIETEIEKALDILISNGNLEDLKNSPIYSEFKEKFGINHLFTLRRFGSQHHGTLLHRAYHYNKPEFVKFLTEEGASEAVPDHSGKSPMDRAPANYKDTNVDRVINTITRKYLKKASPETPDANLLFDVIKKLITKRQWKYTNSEKLTSFPIRNWPPFRDEGATFLGSSKLSYHVNCIDLSDLFVKAANVIGLESKKFWYQGYKSIKRNERDAYGVIGDLKLFDGSRKVSEDSQIEFMGHSVVHSQGWNYDLTLLCKYQGHDINTYYQNPNYLAKYGLL